MMDDKISDRGDLATHKRHGRQYASSLPSASSNVSTTASSSSASAAANSFSTLLRRYAPAGFSTGGGIGNAMYRKQKTGAPSASTSASSAAASATVMELYSIRDKTDATAKRAFRVQIPVRLMYSVWAVFLILPIFLFGWKETHWTNTTKRQEISSPQTIRLRRSDQQARQDSNWMEEHLLTTTASGDVSESQPVPVQNNSTTTTTAMGDAAAAAHVVGDQDAASRSQSVGLPVTKAIAGNIQTNSTISMIAPGDAASGHVNNATTNHAEDAPVEGGGMAESPAADSGQFEAPLEAELVQDVMAAVVEDEGAV